MHSASCSSSDRPNPAASTSSGHVSRRTFLGAGLAGAAVAGAATGCSTGKSSLGHSRGHAAHLPLIVSTWPFGKPANEKALAVLQSGRDLLDAIVEGISITESDLAVDSVGAGGAPNADGVVSLDACIMDGRNHKCGSVGAVEGILPMIGLARAVMEKTRHVMLVGEGARRFALANGFKDTNLLTDAQRQKWIEWKAKQAKAGSAPPDDSHDTIALVAMGADGNLAGGCSTSGLAYKLPGRVGDSPIIGGGLYVDNEVGGAGATGTGENVMRFCGTYQVVEFMRAGAHPEEACIETIRRIQKKHAPGTEVSISFFAVDKRGRFGGAGTKTNFHYSVTYPGYSEVIRGVEIPPRT